VEAAAWCFWCLCVGSRSSGAGRFSLSPLFYETVGFFIGIPHDGGNMVFRSLAVRQPAAADGLSSPVQIKMVADARSTPMIWLRDDAGHEILRFFQHLTPLVKDGGGLGGSPTSSGGLEKSLEFGVASCNFQSFLQGFSCNLMGRFCVIR
jgi:hypothetical protein